MRPKAYGPTRTHVKFRPHEVAELFGRHLDLGPLRGRRRGLVSCIFHDDRRPSLSLDLDLGLFHYFGCGAEGGVRHFAVLVGETASDVPAPAAREPESELDRAKRIVAAQEEAWARWRAEWRDLWYAADFIRLGLRLADTCYRRAGAMPSLEATWDAVNLGAQLEREAHCLDMAFDDCLAPPMRRCP